MSELKKAASARQRAREARSAALAEQRAAERRIEDAYTAAFEALQGVEAAQLALQAADAQLAQAVAALRGEKESQAAIATALELPAKEVQRLLREAQARQQQTGAATPAAG